MKKWCIKVTEENLPIVGKWFNENNQNGFQFNHTEYVGTYLHYPMLINGKHSNNRVVKNYTELTFEQFKEQILKEPNVLQEIFDKIRENIYHADKDYRQEKQIVDFSDIEQIFSNYLNK